MCGAGNYMMRQAAKDANLPLPNPEQRGLIVFARVPELGKVKTRLAATIGDEAALGAYVKMLEVARETCMAVDAERHVFYSPLVPEQDETWPDTHFHKHPQAEGDLGHKMQAAFDALFARGLEKVLIIGTDCPGLKPSHLQAAYRALALHDFVIGPALDGGYYLLGMRKTEPRLFAGKQWSTETVLKDTLEDIRQLGKTVHQLSPLRDVDTEEDWVAVKGFL